MKDIESAEVNRGKEVFAATCARCHSSKLPEKAYSFFNKGRGNESCTGPGYTKCWNDYWAYTKTDEFKSEMAKIVKEKDFLENNFLSTDLRIPSSLLDTQLCSPIATNAIKNNIWDNFSSTSYKTLPSAGQFRVNYMTASGLRSEMIKIPDGGRGFIRPASLVSVWSTAPYLTNNSVGKFDLRGTVEGRMRSFEDSIQKLLNPELRAQNPKKGELAVTYETTFGDKLPGVIDVTTEDSYVKIPKGYLPNFVFRWLQNTFKDLSEPASNWSEQGYVMNDIGSDAGRAVASVEPPAETPKKNWFARFIASVTGGDPESYDGEEAAIYSPREMGEILRLGPIPAGVPVNLISNINMEAKKTDLIKAVTSLIKAIHEVRKAKTADPALAPEKARDLFMSIAAEPLIKVSKCSDFVVNRGHYFGTQYSQDKSEALSAEDKAALIEYLKHF